MSEKFTPYVPEQTSLKEFTIKAVLSGALFGIIFGAANAYVGLYIGLMVSRHIDKIEKVKQWQATKEIFYSSISNTARFRLLPDVAANKVRMALAF